MNKTEFINAVSASTGLSKADTTKTLDAVFEEITKALAKKDSCQFVGFGTFKTSEREARTGRNPQTGEAINIAASTVARFVPGKALKDAIN